jgi:heat shock protein HslJ
MSLAGFLIAGCQAAGSPGPSVQPLPELDGTKWRAVRVGAQTPAAANSPTLVFNGDRIEGSDGCNTFGGNGPVDAGRLVLGEVAQTLMLCQEPINGIATAYMATLRGGQLLPDADGRLVIRGAATDVVLVRDEG